MMGTEVFRTEVKSKFSLETYALEEALKGKKKTTNKCSVFKIMQNKLK